MSRESWPSMLGEMRCTAWHLPEVRTLVNGIIAQAERLAEASLLRGLSDSELYAWTKTVRGSCFGLSWEHATLCETRGETRLATAVGQANTKRATHKLVYYRVQTIKR